MLRAVSFKVRVEKGHTIGKISLPKIYRERLSGEEYLLRGFIRTLILKYPVMTGSTATFKLYSSDDTVLYDSTAKSTGQDVVIHMNYDLSVMPGDQLRIESASSEGAMRDVTVILRVERR